MQKSSIKCQEINYLNPSLQSTDYIPQFIYWILSARTLQHMMVQILSQSELLQTCGSAQILALHTGMLRVDQATHEQSYTKSMWSRYKRNLPGGTDIFGYEESTHHLWGNAPSSQDGHAKKFSVSNFHQSREHFVRRLNVHFVTCSRESENMQEDFHKAGWFGQLCEVTHSMLLPGDSSSAETSTASGLRPLHSGLLWSLPKI